MLGSLMRPADNVDAAVAAAEYLMYRDVMVSGKNAVRVMPFLAQQSPIPGDDR